MTEEELEKMTEEEEWKDLSSDVKIAVGSYAATSFLDHVLPKQPPSPNTNQIQASIIWLFLFLRIGLFISLPAMFCVGLFSYILDLATDIDILGNMEIIMQGSGLISIWFFYVWSLVLMIKSKHNFSVFIISSVVFLLSVKCYLYWTTEGYL